LLFTAAISAVHEVKGQAIPDAPAATAATSSSNAKQATSPNESKSVLAESNSTTQKSGGESANEAPTSRRAASSASDAPAETPTSSLSEIRTQIVKHFVKSLDGRALDEGAIRGMMQALDDPHSEFLSPDKFKELTRGIEGVLTGIGIEVSTTTENELVVVTPLPGSPAEAAGVRPGDAILAIDGMTVQALGHAVAIDAIRGQAGSVVALRVKRGGEESILKVTRASIRMPSIKGMWIDTGTRKWNFWLDQEQKLGYVQIGEFGKTAVEDCRSAVKSLLEQGPQGTGARPAALSRWTIGGHGGNRRVVSARRIDCFIQGGAIPGDDLPCDWQELPGSFSPPGAGRRPYGISRRDPGRGT
jgi:C-terminal processing protease CtpA/Prc